MNGFSQTASTSLARQAYHAKFPFFSHAGLCRRMILNDQCVTAWIKLALLGLFLRKTVLNCFKHVEIVEVWHARLTQPAHPLMTIFGPGP